MKKFLSVFLCLALVFSVVITASVSADTQPVITVSNVTAQQGETVKVDISIDNNPGIMGMTFCVTYDVNALEYAGYEEGYLTNYSVLNHADKGEISIVNIEDNDVANDGVIVTVVFTIKETAEFADYEIGIVNKNPEKYGDSLHDCFSNSKEQFIVPIVNNGCINVIKIISGDANGDGEVTSSDFSLLIQYLNGWNVTIDLMNSDANYDGAVNARDCALLIQYLNGWDVKLGKQK